MHDTLLVCNDDRELLLVVTDDTVELRLDSGDVFTIDRTELASAIARPQSQPALRAA